MKLECELRLWGRNLASSIGVYFGLGAQPDVGRFFEELNKRHVGKALPVLGGVTIGCWSDPGYGLMERVRQSGVGFKARRGKADRPQVPLSGLGHGRLA